MNVKDIIGLVEKATLIVIAFFTINAVARDQILILDQKTHPFFCAASALTCRQAY